MDYPKFIVSNQKEESISIQRVNHKSDRAETMWGNKVRIAYIVPPDIQESHNGGHLEIL